jgi:murein DD-endopeptidase MepM/ murein hydrolase activator NlpD
VQGFQQVPPTFQWPVGSSSTNITQWYARYNGGVNRGNGGHHTGLDIASTDTTVRAAASGFVRRIDNGILDNDDNHGMGNIIIIDHENKLYTLYAHLESISVSNGEFVTQGTAIGIMGETGCPGCGDHLHFEVRLWNVIGNLDDNFGPVWGYTRPGREEANRPNWYGYINPFPYLEFAINELEPIVVEITTNDEPIRTGPDTSYDQHIGTVSKGQKFVAFNEFNGWYQVYFPSTQILPKI